MNSQCRCFFRAAALFSRQMAMAMVALAVGLPVSLSADQNVTRTFSLRSGWNAIWLDVEPTNAAIGAVFSGAPMVSVWTYADRLSAVDFIANTSEPVWNRDRWLRYVPTNNPAAFQNNLFATPGHRAYLIQLTNTFTLRVTGRPSWRQRAWAPDAYNLRGFPIDPASPPTFLEFFRPSPAHYDAAAARLQKIYRLAPTGQWTLVSPGDLIAPGEAYWVFTRGGSDFVAPLDVRLEGGDGLDFGRGLDSRNVKLHNLRTSNGRVSIQDLASPSPLSYARFHPTNGTEWVALSGMVTQDLAAAASAAWRVALRRQDIAGSSHGSVLELKDGLGTRVQLPVTGEKLGSTAGGGMTNGAGVSLAGLWMGTASIEAVNEVNTANAGATTPTAAPFNLRLLLHVDNQGTVRLLKEVTQLWQDGTTTNNAAGQAVLQTPGRYVLVTDESLFSRFKGATLRGGTAAGRRLSAVGFDFPKVNGTNSLTLSGTFGSNSTLTGTITLPPDFPTNPFRHKYHPDHDNLDDRFANYQAEAYEVQRAFSLTFSPTASSGGTTPDYGYGSQEGIYRETVTGLNKSPITCQGTFRLRRVADTAVLNQ